VQKCDVQERLAVIPAVPSRPDQGEVGFVGDDGPQELDHLRFRQVPEAVFNVEQEPSIPHLVAVPVARVPPEFLHHGLDGKAAGHEVAHDFAALLLRQRHGEGSVL
jgi:hypothetical protein